MPSLAPEEGWTVLQFWWHPLGRLPKIGRWQHIDPTPLKPGTHLSLVESGGPKFPSNMMLPSSVILPESALQPL